MVGAVQPKPATVDTSKFAKGFGVFPEAILDKKAQVSEPPRNEAQPRHTEQRSQDLRIYVNPLPSWGIDVVTIWVTHRWSCIAKEERDHAPPSDHVKTI